MVLMALRSDITAAVVVTSAYWNVLLPNSPVIVFMPTKLADRVIISLTALKHRWRNPLNRMKSSAVGLYPLPVELWQEILAIAGSPDEGKEEILYSALTSCFFTTKENIFQTPLTTQHRLLLRTRHSIILVCKSWYFMGIHILWSHLQFNEEDPRNVGTMIYSAIKRNPILVSHVVRLTIKSVLLRQENLVQPEKIHAVAKFVPLLTNLKAISCSLPYAAHIYPATRPRLVILNNHDEDGSKFMNNAVGSASLLLKNSFWAHCNTLSLSLIKPFGFDSNGQYYGTAQLRFENLTSLRLNIFHVAIMRWIEESWQFPILKSLSLTYTANADRIALLERVRMTLEELEIRHDHIEYCSLDSTHEMELPKLKEISLVQASCFNLVPRHYWFAAIKAPNLGMLIISVRLSVHGWLYPQEAISAHRNILGRFPSIRRVTIITPDWIPRTEKDKAFLRVVMHRSDQSEWHQVARESLLY
jgi:hypothetical protein